MQIGYNNDVQYRGKTFHIQTEDHGEKAGAIETQLFHAGAIFDTSIISYKKVLEETEDVDDRIARIRTLMQTNHKSLYKKLLAGEYDELAGMDPLADDEQVEADDLVPAQERVPASALEVEQGLREFPEQEHGESVDLSKIREALKADADGKEGKEKPSEEKAEQKPPNGVANEESEAAPTMMMSLNDLSVGTVDAPRTSALIPDFAPSGAIAFRGCMPPTEDLSVSDLVEKFLNT